MPTRLALEPLERRDTPAFVMNLSGATASVVGDGGADTLIITESLGFLHHNRESAGDPGFVSDFDWVSNAAGEQRLAASSTSRVTVVTLGGGDDTLMLGRGASPFSNVRAAITVSDGGAGSDRLVVDNSQSPGSKTYAYSSTGVTGAGPAIENFATFETGETYLCGASRDTFNVGSSKNDLTVVNSGGGSDLVVVGSAGSMEAVVSRITVNNTGSLPTDLRLDDTNDASGDTVTISSSGPQTTTAGLSAGSVAYDEADVNVLTVAAGSGDDSFTFSTDDEDLTVGILGRPGKDTFTVAAGAGGANTTVRLFGQDGDDTFVVTGAGVPSFVVLAAGREGADVLRVTPAAGATAVVTPIRPGVTDDGAEVGFFTPAAGAGPVNFEQVESVVVAGTPAELEVRLKAGGNPDVVLGDDGTAADPDGTPDAGFSLLSGSTIVPVAFASPAGELTVTLGDGGDTITMNAMDAAFAPAGGVVLTGGAAADTFVVRPDDERPVLVNGNAPTTAPGDTLRIPTAVVVTALTKPSGSLGAAPGRVVYQGIETLDVPRPVFADREFAAGADSGGGGVRFFNPDGTERFTLTPFGKGFAGGVRVAGADFTGDGVADVVVGTGPGGPTRVTVFDGVTKAERFTTAPFEAAFTGGVYVAAGDLNGDGVPELIITPDEGGGPRVKVISGATFGLLADFFGIDDATFRGGARAAVGDVDGDGFGELVVCAGFGGGPRVAAFKGSAAFANNPPKLFADFFLFEQALRNGAFVAVGDVNGDGNGDLIGGGGPGGAPRVLLLSGADLTAGKADGSAPLANFFAGDTASRGGVRVAARHLDADATADVVVGAGSGAGSRVTAYLGKNLTPTGTPAEALAFDAFPGVAAGVFVG